MGNVIQNIPLIELITGDLHPHLEFQEDNLDNLINSIKKFGIIEPLLVRPKDNKYEIILGNRRYNAAKQLGIETIPVIIINVNDEVALNMIITDNIQRKELSSKEEAKLYEKALSYPNINKEQLSINLGIPLDRINSKLDLIKKESLQPTSNNDMNQSQYLNSNNSINSDIINLSELNKEEQERDEYEMNNNQFVENNLDNNLNNVTQNQEQPTFGGRFFPSLEDQPTNMNMGPSPIPDYSNTTINNNQLIDLTDTSTNDNINNIQENNTISSIPTNEVVNNISIPEPPLAENISNSTIDNNVMNNNISDINIPNMEQQQMNNNNIQPNINIPNIPDVQNTINMPTTNNSIAATEVQQPVADISSLNENLTELNIPNAEQVTSEMPTSPIDVTAPIGNQEGVNIPNIEQSIPNMPTSPMDVAAPIGNQEGVNIPNIEQSIPNMPTSPIDVAAQIDNQKGINIPNIEQSIPVPNNQINIENIPNLGVNEIPSSDPEINDSNYVEQTVSNTQIKDVLPVINMIKNLAINIESLGYKLTITEEDNNESYKINIEVDK